MSNVKISARVGSPRFEDTANGCNSGITSSLAIAWSNLGAPVKLWRPAPSVDRNEPIKMTHSFGHAIFATTNRPPIECPSLNAYFATKRECNGENIIKWQWMENACSLKMCTSICFLYIWKWYLYVNFALCNMGNTNILITK